MRSAALYCVLLSILVGCDRFRGPVAVGELMHFFDATHESINNVYTSRVTSRVSVHIVRHMSSSYLGTLWREPLAAWSRQQHIVW